MPPTRNDILEIGQGLYGPVARCPVTGGDLFRACSALLPPGVATCASPGTDADLNLFLTGSCGERHYIATLFSPTASRVSPTTEIAQV